MSVHNPWNHWEITSLSLITAAVAVFAVGRLDAQSGKKSSTIVKIQNDKSRKCITVEKPGKGEYVLQFDCNRPGAANRWIKENSTEAPYFTLKVRAQNRDWCIGVSGGDPRPDTQLQLFQCDGKANQRWKIDGARIKNYDQLCIGVDHASGEEPAVLKQFKCDSNSNQKWRFIGS